MKISNPFSLFRVTDIKFFLFRLTKLYA